MVIQPVGSANSASFIGATAPTSASAIVVIDTVSFTNADGSVTTITTYADGHKESETVAGATTSQSSARGGGGTTTPTPTPTTTSGSGQTLNLLV